MTSMTYSYKDEGNNIVTQTFKLRSAESKA